jgi:hypothetical protein
MADSETFVSLVQMTATPPIPFKRLKREQEPIVFISKCQFGIDALIKEYITASLSFSNTLELGNGSNALVLRYQLLASIAYSPIQ